MAAWLGADVVIRRVARNRLPAAPPTAPRRTRHWRRGRRGRTSRVLNPAYSKSISHSRLPSSMILAGSRSLCPKTMRQRHLCLLQFGVDREQFGQPLRQRVAARRERMGVVADDVEHPEHEARPGHQRRHFVVETAQQTRDPPEVGPHVRLAEHLAVDEPRHHQARLGVDDLGGEAGGVRGPRRHQLRARAKRGGTDSPFPGARRICRCCR